MLVDHTSLLNIIYYLHMSTVSCTSDFHLYHAILQNVNYTHKMVFYNLSYTENMTKKKKYPNRRLPNITAESRCVYVVFIRN